MKNKSTKFTIGTIIFFALSVHVYAARMYIESPHSASSNREPLAVSIFLDPETDTLSGISGDFSFPSNLFEVERITTFNSVVPLWITEPQISVEKRFDQRTHITFGGIIPGGFSGVHTPYSTGVFPGIIFTVSLIPKGEGVGEFTVKDVELHELTNTANILPSNGDIKKIVVPHLTGKEVARNKVLTLIKSDSLESIVNTSDLVNNGHPYIYVRDTNQVHTIDHIELAESDEYNPNHVSPYEWHTITNPYSLKYSARTKYIHTKVVYTDNTYAYKTLQPVENSRSLFDLSRILIYIIVVISFLYFYAPKFLHVASKIKERYAHR